MQLVDLHVLVQKYVHDIYQQKLQSRVVKDVDSLIKLPRMKGQVWHALVTQARPNSLTSQCTGFHTYK